MNDKSLRRLIRSEVRTILKEDYAKGIPDFALGEVAQATIVNLKHHLNNHILQTCSDAIQQKKKFEVANEVCKKLEPEIKSLLEEKLLDFMRQV